MGGILSYTFCISGVVGVWGGTIRASTFCVFFALHKPVRNYMSTTPYMVLTANTFYIFFEYIHNHVLFPGFMWRILSRSGCVMQSLPLLQGLAFCFVCLMECILRFFSFSHVQLNVFSVVTSIFIHVFFLTRPDDMGRPCWKISAGNGSWDVSLSDPGTTCLLWEIFCSGQGGHRVRQYGSPWP